MNRRNFLRAMIGGVAAGAAVRTFPFRVYSFPTDIQIATRPPMRIPIYPENAVQDYVWYMHPEQFAAWEGLMEECKAINVRDPFTIDKIDRRKKVLWCK